MKVLRYLLSLITIVAGQLATAQDISTLDIADTYWEEIHDENTVTIGPTIYHFSQEKMSATIYGRGGQRIHLSDVNYYLSGHSTEVFDKEKVGKDTSGQWLVSENKDGSVSCVRISVTNNNQLQWLDNGKPTRQFKKVAADYVLNWEGKTEESYILQICEMLNKFNSDPKALNLLNQTPGGLIHELQETSLETIRAIEKLRVYGPINGEDMQTLYAVVGMGSEFPNIKVLDLSRAWIVGDTIPYASYTGEWSHQVFTHTEGRHSRVAKKEMSFLGDFSDWPDTFETLLNQDGYILEKKADELYQISRTTKTGVLSSAMFFGWPYIEHLLLPHYTTTIEQRAIMDCKSLKEITIYAETAFLGEEAIIDCPQLEAIHLQGNYYLKYLSDENRSGRFFFVTPADDHLKIDFQPTPFPFIENESDSVKAIYENLRKELMNLERKRSEKEYERQRQYTADGIRRKTQERDKIEKERDALLREITLRHTDNILPAELVTDNSLWVSKELLYTIIAIMDDANVHSVSMQPAWRRLVEASDANPTDWNTPTYHSELHPSLPSNLGGLSAYNQTDVSKSYDLKLTPDGTLFMLISDGELEELESLRISGSLSKDELLRIKEHGKQLRVLDLQETTLTELPDHAFEQSKLKTVILPAHLSSIGESAFRSCTRLETVVFPMTLKVIGNQAFEDCEQLLYAHLPEGLETLGDKSFNYCRQLRAVTLPSTLKQIGYRSFARCKLLRELHVPEGVTSIGMNVLVDSNPTVTIAPGNKHFQVIENCIVGKTLEARKLLHQE